MRIIHVLWMIAALLIHSAAFAQEEMAPEGNDSEYLKAYEACVQIAEKEAGKTAQANFDDLYDAHFKKCMAGKGFDQSGSGPADDTPAE